MSRHPKLELTWIGKDDRPRLEPRILLEDMALSHHARTRYDGDIFDNRLIFGDNLLALKALEQEFSGKIKCIFIDPPYNTGSAFEHYDDGVEHSIWLSLIRDRIEIIYNLLSDDGSLWVSIDDNEVHYLKVVVDEIFGRTNFLGNIVWQSKDTPGNNSSGISQTHNHIICWRKTELFTANRLSRTNDQDKYYSNPDKDQRGSWLGTPLTRVEHRDRDFYPLTAPDGRRVLPPQGSSWRRPPEMMRNLEADGRIWWGVKGDAAFPKEKKFLTEVKQEVVNQTWWPYEFAGSTRNASTEMKGIFGHKAFDTPKPEKLVLRILSLATNPGDLVLDSFAGSGTTGAVSHKMGRRWIMIEIGEHAITHCVPRLNKVIDGEDPGGITETVGWKGGGGFRFYRLAPSLLTKDRFDNWIIAPDYNAAMLAEAVCKLMGFTYAPSQEPEEYWRHGHSTETDFIYVTTQSLTHDALKKLSDEVGPKRTLLVCCKAWNGNESAVSNLTIKKIPQAVLKKCEWGRDDYSLQIANLPIASQGNGVDTETDSAPSDAAPAKRRGRPRKENTEPSLFGDDAEPVDV
jgi:adenine-specific DNA-methyltransferase